MNFEKIFDKFASATARVTGNPATFLVCVALVVVWAASGPVFKFSETWQLVINTGTTIVTFLMVFLIQNTQNRDSEAIQTKLDVLILASEADNNFVGIEDLTDSQLDSMHKRAGEVASRHRQVAEKVKAELDSRSGKGKAASKTRKTPAAKPAARRKTT